jgi:radical SAM/Cys-rich protein
MSGVSTPNRAENRSREPSAGVEAFSVALARHGCELTRSRIITLQINTGLVCNQYCQHCHLDAGPARSEMMDLETMRAVVDFARRHRFAVIDITGGAPELNEHLGLMVEQLAPWTPRIMLRSNLTAISSTGRKPLLDGLVKHRVVMVASLPSLNETQAAAQRGPGVLPASLATLQRLNALGYGQADSGLELNLVANPTGAFLAPPQKQTEERFRLLLQKKWGIVFNHLYSFSNVPLGRFRQWLLRSGNLEAYMQRLAASFNPCAVDGLMCRTLLSVSWDGLLYDCDFNLANGLFMGGRRTHLRELKNLPAAGAPIAVADHCYACTAGAGFT